MIEFSTVGKYGRQIAGYGSWKEAPRDLFDKACAEATEIKHEVADFVSGDWKPKLCGNGDEPWLHSECGTFLQPAKVLHAILPEFKNPKERVIVFLTDRAQSAMSLREFNWFLREGFL